MGFSKKFLLKQTERKPYRFRKAPTLFLVTLAKIIIRPSTGYTF